MSMPGQIALRTALWSSVLLAAASVGCSNKQVRIEMRSGAEGPVRTFETNRTTGEERTRLTEVYESGPLEATDGRSGVRFEGVFLDRDLPSEVGNRNGWSVLEGEFGSAYLYVEQFGEGRDDWKEFGPSYVDGLSSGEPMDLDMVQRRLSQGDYDVI